MAIAERALVSTHQTESVRDREIPVNTGVIATFYEAKFMLGMATPEDLDAARNLIPPIVKFSINGPKNTKYRTIEGPNVAGMIDALDSKSEELEGSLVGLTRRKARKVHEELGVIDRVRTALDGSSTRPIDNNSTPEEVAQSIWGVGNRSEVPGYMAYRIGHDANRIVHIYKLTHNQYGPAFKKAAEALNGRRELIVSDDPRFYEVTRCEATSDDMALVPHAGLGLESEGGEDIHQSNEPFQDEKSERDQPKVLIATEVKVVKQPRIKKHTRQITLNRRPIVASAVLLTMGVTAGMEAKGTTHVLQALRDRGAVTRTVTPAGSIGLESTITIPAATMPTTSTTLEQKSTTTTTSTTLPPAEVIKPVDPIGVAWLSDTMKPWKEQIAKESSKYGLDAAVPAIVVQAKTAGDYMVNNNGLKGLFLLTDKVVEDAINAGIVKAPAEGIPVEALNSDVNIKIGVWNIARLMKSNGGSVRQMAIAMEGGVGETVDYIEGMWNERNQVSSPTLDRWKKKYGYIVDRTRDKLLKQGLL